MHAKFHAYRFAVSGSGRFPVDMLRYDRCVPYAQDDVSTMGTGHRYEDTEPQRRVNLIAYVRTGNTLTPTAGRWSSFGWHVIPGSIEPIRT